MCASACVYTYISVYKLHICTHIHICNLYIYEIYTLPTWMRLVQGQLLLSMIKAIVGSTHMHI